jgi:hypothetical protein
VLLADAHGVARQECRHSMCFAARSGLGFTDTFAVHLPWWRFRVSAPGFAPKAWADLDVEENRQAAYRADPGNAKLLVPVSLLKDPAAPGAVADRPRDWRCFVFQRPCPREPAAVLGVRRWGRPPF